MDQEIFDGFLDDIQIGQEDVIRFKLVDSEWKLDDMTSV